jgi:hypothetical protein
VSIVQRARRHGERLRRIQHATWDAWWACVWRTRLPRTDIEYDSSGTLYIRRGATVINVDRARKKGKL